MSSDINFGILGYGKMGKIRHQTLLKMEKCVPLAYFENEPEITPPENIIRIKSSDELISLKEIDALIISVPNYLIKPYVVSALNSGKHVFCEKPPGINLSETIEIKQALERSDRKLMFGFNHRHHKSIMKTKETVDSGDFGEILWMRGRYGKSVKQDFYDDWRSKNKFAGGGIFLDQGIHMLDLFMHLAGKFEEIKSFVSNLYWKGDVEDNVFALFRNNKGQVASLHSTMTQWRHLFSLEIFLEQGYIVLNGLKTSSNSYGDEQLNIVKNRTSAPAATWTKEEEYFYSIDDSWERELTIFRDAILENRPIEKCGIQDAENLMEMVDQVYSQ